jgi:choline dehydrogenase
VTAGELIPGDSVSDADAARHVFRALAPYGHPTSTAPMGSDVMPWAVVDSVGAVKGVERLRVVDASIIPEVPSTVTNLTVIMIAERIFDRVYRRQTPPRASSGRSAAEHSFCAAPQEESSRVVDGVS